MHPIMAILLDWLDDVVKRLVHEEAMGLEAKPASLLP